MKDFEHEKREISENLESTQNKILMITSKMVNNGQMNDSEAGEINNLANQGRFDEALDLIEEYRDRDQLTFEDEEKQVFADRFSDVLDEVVDEIESMKDAIDNLQGGVSRKDLKTYIYGKNSGRTHKQVDSLFDAIDSLTSGGASNRKIAKVLTSFDSNLTISETETMIDEIREKANEVEN